ncbi:MAG: hypothetical protein ABL962_11015 [Fimbriimonadaceae bacterium]
MTESAPVPSRKRRRWLFALPLVLVGLAWWWSTRPPPLPKFLEPFAQRITYRERWRDRDVYFFQVAVEDVIVSLAKEVGGNNIRLNSIGGYYRPPSKGPSTGVNFTSTLRQKQRGTLIEIWRTPTELSWVDHGIRKICPRWIELRLGPIHGGPVFTGDFWPDASYSPEVMRKLLTDHDAKATR